MAVSSASAQDRRIRDTGRDELWLELHDPAHRAGDQVAERTVAGCSHLKHPARTTRAGSTTAHTAATPMASRSGPARGRPASAIPRPGPRERPGRTVGGDSVLGRQGSYCLGADQTLKGPLTRLGAAHRKASGTKVPDLRRQHRPPQVEADRRAPRPGRHPARPTAAQDRRCRACPCTSHRDVEADVVLDRRALPRSAPGRLEAARRSAEGRTRNRHRL